jgi:glycosyltransferase involved in cell wall biosynthesis
MADEGVELVHANGLFALLTALPPAKLRGIPVVGHLHSFNGLDHSAAGFFFRRTDTIVPVCEAMAEEIRSRWGLTSNCLRMIPNGIDVNTVKSRAREERVEISAGWPVIGTVTTFHPDKGFDILLEAIRQMGSAAAGLRLAVLGDGPGRVGMEALAGEYGLNEMIHWLGYRDNPYPFISGFDLYVSPSLTEAAPISVLEAAALGVPILAASVGGVPEMVDHGVSGWLVPPSDPAALAGALKLLLTDKELRANLAAAAKKRVRTEFTAKRMANDFEKIYRSLLSSA